MKDKCKYDVKKEGNNVVCPKCGNVMREFKNIKCPRCNSYIFKKCSECNKCSLFK